MNTSLRYAVCTIRAIIKAAQPHPDFQGEYVFATNQIFGYKGNTGSAAVGLLELLGYIVLENRLFSNQAIRVYRLTEENLELLKKLVQDK